MPKLFSNQSATKVLPELVQSRGHLRAASHMVLKDVCMILFDTFIPQKRISSLPFGWAIFKTSG